MQELNVDLGERSYKILIGQGLISKGADSIKPVLQGKDVFLVVDENSARPHGQMLEESLIAAGLRVVTHILPAGEPTKSTARLDELWDALSGARFGRQAALVAVGGGVTGDLAGFAAATYLRGIDFIQVPTTLLAMVDSSVGGKTGINNRHGKNLLGAFWQPKLVLADTDTLKTLPEGERTSALAEIIKYGVIADADFFQWIEKNITKLRELDTESISHAVRRSCEIKADVVTKDERESGLRKILNFGHTVGHAIENSTGYGVLRHGEAISIGMVVESALGVDQSPGWSEGEHLRLVSLLKAAGLPTRLPKTLIVSLDALFEAAATDKKNRDGAIHYMVPRKLGHVEAVSLANSEVAPHLVASGAKRPTTSDTQG